MTRDIPQPFRVSIDLPDYQAILAVDAEGYTKTPGVTHQALSEFIPTIVGGALEAAGVRAEWINPSFFGPTGDGFAVGLPTRVLPYIVFPFFHHLQKDLERHNQSLAPGEPRIRLRASLNVGPLPTSHPDASMNGNGAERNNTHRLLDSTPVRAVLGGASPQVTYIVAILSERVFQDVVANGYCGLHPDHFIPVNATVSEKQFAQNAWLLVPKPSGSLIGLGIAVRTPPTVADAQESVSADGSRPPAQMHVGTNLGQAVSGVVHGGMHQHTPEIP